jgi:hypothetical protein
MKCIPRNEGKDILEEIHNGLYGNHVFSHAGEQSFSTSFLLAHNSGQR